MYISVHLNNQFNICLYKYIYVFNNKYLCNKPSKKSNIIEAVYIVFFTFVDLKAFILLKSKC